MKDINEMSYYELVTEKLTIQQRLKQITLRLSRIDKTTYDLKNNGLGRNVGNYKN